jgi:hypothetical protein
MQNEVSKGDIEIECAESCEYCDDSLLTSWTSSRRADTLRAVSSGRTDATHRSVGRLTRRRTRDAVIAWIALARWCSQSLAIAVGSSIARPAVRRLLQTRAVPVCADRTRGWDSAVRRTVGTLRAENADAGSAWT